MRVGVCGCYERPANRDHRFEECPVHPLEGAYTYESPKDRRSSHNRTTAELLEKVCVWCVGTGLWGLRTQKRRTEYQWAGPERENARTQLVG